MSGVYKLIRFEVLRIVTTLTLQSGLSTSMEGALCSDWGVTYEKEFTNNMKKLNEISSDAAKPLMAYPPHT